MSSMTSSTGRSSSAAYHSAIFPREPGLVYSLTAPTATCCRLPAAGRPTATRLAAPPSAGLLLLLAAPSARGRCCASISVWRGVR
jgi:hypothetical protein